MNQAPNCNNCVKAQYCQMYSKTGGCTDWVGMIVEEPIRLWTINDNKIPTEPYPNIYELKDRIMKLEMQVERLEQLEQLKNKRRR